MPVITKHFDLDTDETLVANSPYRIPAQSAVKAYVDNNIPDISTLQPLITSTNKLNSDLVDDTNQTNKFVTTAEKTTWSGKQDAISDLSTIRAGAALGDTAVQPGDNVSDLTNDAGYLTSVDWSDIEDKPESFAPAAHTQASNTINAMTGYTKASSVSAIVVGDTLNGAVGKLEKGLDGKQDIISDLSDIRSNATAGAGAASTIAGYGDIVTYDARNFLASTTVIPTATYKIWS